MQQRLYQRALQLQRDNTCELTSQSDFREYFTPRDADRPEIHGGFALCNFTEGPEVDQFLKELKVTIRCVPLDSELSQREGTCIVTGRPSQQRAVFAKAY